MTTVRARATGSRIGNGHVTLYSLADRCPYYRQANVDRDGRPCQRSLFGPGPRWSRRTMIPECLGRSRSAQLNQGTRGRASMLTWAKVIGPS